MSSGGERRPYAEAMPRAEAVVKMLADVCQCIEIAGSLRRCRETVGDVEIVAQPKAARHLLNRLDALLLKGTISKALYGEGAATRWGEKYRGFVFEGMRFEVFLADENNLGYILWLRTGPGDANTYVMQACARKACPVSARGGYWWHRENRLRVDSEATLFALLGMGWLEPRLRRVEVYYEQLNRRGHHWMPAAALEALYVDESQPVEPVQRRLL
jgi:DNA polymerase (family 10)